MGSPPAAELASRGQPVTQCQGTGPPGGLVLTFDDSFADNWYDQVRPVLDRYQVKATFFVSRYYSMSSARKAKMSALAAAGHEIGSHTMDHGDTEDYTTASYMQEQVVPDVANLTAGGLFPRSFAYPYGGDTAELNTELLRGFDYVRDTRNTQNGSTLVPNLDGAFHRCDGNRLIASVGLDVQYGHSDQELRDGLERARCERSNLLVYGHHMGVPPAGSAASYYVPERLELLLTEAAAKGLRVRRVRDLCSWQSSARGTGAPARVNDSPLRRGDVLFGDFDGDGDSDAFQATGSYFGKWRILQNRGGTFYAPGSAERWTDLNASTVPLSRIALGDFDGDRRTDVFYADGSRWFLSSAGSGAPVRINSRSELVGELGFGDFNGDGKTDVFRASGSRWHVSHGGSSSWVQINSSPVTLAELAFGDFDGDRRTDVMQKVGSQWRVSYRGESAWTVLNGNVAEALQAVLLADLDGDGKTDALRSTGTEWSISSGAAGPWVKLRDSTVPLADLSLLDLNGDGVTDILDTAPGE